MDPLTRSYPELTPYQFASNRPIDGIDLDGLEYMDSDETHYYINIGQVWIKPVKFNQLYGINASNHAASIRSDAYGNQYIGATEPVGQVRFSRENSQSSSLYKGGTYKFLNKLKIRIHDEYVNSIKRIDGNPKGSSRHGKRYYQSSGTAAGLGKFGLALAAVDLGMDAYKSIQGLNILLSDKKESGYIRSSFESINEALNQGKIAPQFQNISDLSQIANFLFQGTEIQNKELQATAEYISKNIAKNYKYEIGTEVIESGLDNYKSIEIYYEKDVDIKPVK